MCTRINCSLRASWRSRRTATCSSRSRPEATDESPSCATPTATPENDGVPLARAAIHEYNPDGSGHRLFASGLRNPVGLAYTPGTTTLWTAVNERDHLGDDLVPDFITSVRDGGFYGWPYSYLGKHLDPTVNPQRPDLVGKATAPD